MLPTYIILLHTNNYQQSFRNSSCSRTHKKEASNLSYFFQSDDPVIQFRRNNSDASVPVGGYEIMWIDIYIPPGSLATYEVEAFAPGNLSQTEENTMFLCDLRLIQVSKKF